MAAVLQRLGEVYSFAYLLRAIAMNDQLDTLLSEQRRFPPPPQFAARAAATEALYAAGRHPERFWEEQARELEWLSPWRQVLDWKPPHARWFVDGKLNASANCLDRHLKGPRRNKAAIVWEGEPGERRGLTHLGFTTEGGRGAHPPEELRNRRGGRGGPFPPLIPPAGNVLL